MGSCGVRLVAVDGKHSHCAGGHSFACATRTSISVRRGCRASFSCRLPDPSSEQQSVPYVVFPCGSSVADKVCECAGTGCAPNATHPIALSLLRYLNMSVPSLVPRLPSRTGRLAAAGLHDPPPLPPLDYTGPPDAPASLTVAEEHDCRLLIGNHIFEVLNSAVIALSLGLQLKRSTASYTCQGLFDSTGMVEQLPRAPAALRSRPLCPEPHCAFDDDVSHGHFRLRGPPHALYHAGPRGTELNAAGRFQAQEAAMLAAPAVGALVPSARRRALFAHGPHALFGRVFSDLFRFRDYGNASREALRRVKPAHEAVRVSVHIRHREPCLTGTELLQPVARAVRRLVGGRGRACQVLLASDRRSILTKLRPLVAPCDVISVARAAALSRGKFVENGVDAGETAAADIELLARGDHLVGTFGSTFTLLIQSLIAHRYVSRSTSAARPFHAQGPTSSSEGGDVSEEPRIVMCEMTGCMGALPLIADWHLSLQRWPAATLHIGVASGSMGAAATL
jgi:hypothetical protein